MKSVFIQEPNAKRFWRNCPGWILWGVVGINLVSCATFPFADRFWLGELPVLAIFQFPKLAVAEWIRVHVGIGIIRWFGMTGGSFSLGYIQAGPYALVATYLLGVAVAGGFAFRGIGAGDRPICIGFLVSVLTGALDCICILMFGHGRGVVFYG